MNDKELANAVVAILGFEVSDMYDKPLYDWRVAGALTQKVDAVYIEALVDGTWQAQALIDSMPTHVYEAHEAPRAIIEAAVEALT